MGFSRQEYWNELQFAPTGVLPDPGIEPVSLRFAGRFFTVEPPGKPSHSLLTTELPYFLSFVCLFSSRWLVLAIAMVRFYMEKGTHKGLYKSIQKTLKFFQTFALLEVSFQRCLFLYHIYLKICLMEQNQSYFAYYLLPIDSLKTR